MNIAKRFGLRYEPDQQDWEFEVSSPERLQEFIEGYKQNGLSEDERFSLMEVILQSFEEVTGDLDLNRELHEVLQLITTNIDLHIYTVWYWSRDNENCSSNFWKVTPYMRNILNEHRETYT